MFQRFRVDRLINVAFGYLSERCGSRKHQKTKETSNL
jgi:hypothetical protein